MKLGELPPASASVIFPAMRRSRTLTRNFIAASQSRGPGSYISLALSAPSCALQLDWIDNGGRQSPQQLTPGLERLENGQDVMTIFTLTSFKENEHLTVRLKPSRTARSVFGDIAVSYLIVPEAEAVCRLLVKLVVKHSPTVRGRFTRKFLPWGDLVMMRKQLMNLKRLAENSGPPSNSKFN